MTNKKDIITAIVATFCLTIMLVSIMPAYSGAWPYNPWWDLNDDGKIDIQDLARVSGAFGTVGENITKASIEYESGWLNITGEAGQNITIIHNLNNKDIMVDITGKTTANGGIHQRHLGLTEFKQGWAKTFGGIAPEEILWHSFVHTLDGGYAMAGFTTSLGAGGSDFWLVITDGLGDIQWSKTYGGTSNDVPYSLVQTADNGFAIAGITYSSGSGGGDAWLIKTDGNGNAQWNKTYGKTNEGNVWSLVQTLDGGYALAGWTNSWGNGGDDFWLVKTDASGNMQWNKTYGGASEDRAFSMIQTTDGGYALTGRTFSFGPGGDFWLVKTDSSGNAQWNKTYGGAGWDEAYCMIQTSDGGYAIAGFTFSFAAGVNDFWLVKVNVSGTMQWNKTYGGAGGDAAYSLIQTGEGGYALTGETSSFGAGGCDIWLIKTDVDGNVQWNKTYGGALNEFGRCVVQVNSESFAVAGFTASFGDGNGDFWLVQTEAESGLAWIDSTTNTITLHRGATDPYWNFVRVRIWKNHNP